MAKNKDNKTTQFIQNSLNSSERDESALPDHLLTEGSDVKKKRVAERQYAATLAAEEKEYQIERLVREAEMKFREDEEFYNKLLAMEERANYYKHLSRQPSEQDIIRQRILQEQELQRLKILLANFSEALAAVNEKSLTINRVVYGLKDDVNNLKAMIPTLRQQYNSILEKCINAPINNFGNLAIDSLAAPPKFFELNAIPTNKWHLEINEIDFKVLLDAIYRELSTQRKISIHDIPGIINSEVNTFVQNKVADSMQDLKLENKYAHVLDIMHSVEVTSLKQTLATQVQQHITQSPHYKDLQMISQANETTYDQIAEKEVMIQKLENQLELLDKCRETIETAALLNKRILESKQCNPALLAQIFKQGQETLAEVMKSAELSPESLKLIDDPFTDEPGPTSNFRP